MFDWFLNTPLCGYFGIRMATFVSGEHFLKTFPAQSKAEKLQSLLQYFGILRHVGTDPIQLK